MTLFNCFDSDKIPDSVIKYLETKNKSFFTSIVWYKNLIDTVFANDNKWQAFFCFFAQKESVQMFLPLKYSVSDTGVKTFESLENYYSPFYQIISQSNDLSPFFINFKSNNGHWDTLTFRAMSKPDVFMLRTNLKNAGLPSIPFFCFANWYLEVNQRSFDQYFTGLSSRVKNTVTRKTKQFNRLDNSTIKIIYEEDKLNEGIRAFEKVYASSWKEGETYPEFISGLIKIAAKQGYLRLAVAYLNNNPIAAQFWIVADNTAYIYKLAYDEQYKKLSIGSILTVTLMRHVIDIDKVECVDYLSGDDSYKKEWMSHRRERWGIMIFNWRSFQGFFKMVNQFTRFYIKKYIFLKD